MRALAWIAAVAVTAAIAGVITGMLLSGGPRPAVIQRAALPQITGSAVPVIVPAMAGSGVSGCMANGMGRP
jgi:hypothetical protein